MDFNDIEIGENLSEVNNQADRDAWQADQIARLNKESMRMFGCKPISTVQLPRVAANPVSQQEYNTRLYTLLNIIRSPVRATSRYPLSDTWKDCYPMVDYNDKATNWKISKKDAATIIAEMKLHGVYKRFRLDGVASVVARVKEHYQTTRINELEERVKTLELMISDNGSIWYNGVEIERHARQFKVVVNGTTLITRHGTFDKLLDFLKQIDEKL